MSVKVVSEAVSLTENHAPFVEGTPETLLQRDGCHSGAVFFFI